MILNKITFTNTCKFLIVLFIFLFSSNLSVFQCQPIVRKIWRAYIYTFRSQRIYVFHEMMQCLWNGEKRKRRWLIPWRKKGKFKKNWSRQITKYTYFRFYFQFKHNYRWNCSQPSTIRTETIDTAKTESRELNSLWPDVPFLVVNSNNDITYYAFSITDSLFCRRTTRLFNPSASRAFGN